MKSSNLDVLEGVLDKDDAKEPVNRVNERDMEHQVDRALTAAARGKAEPRTRKYRSKDDYSREEAKLLIPAIVRCAITRDDRLHTRWKGSYPADHAPFSFSCTWNATRSCKESLFQVLRWLWERHYEHSGERCPYEL